MDTGEVTYFFKKFVEINSACVGWHKKISQGRVCGVLFPFFFLFLQPLFNIQVWKTEGRSCSVCESSGRVGLVHLWLKVFGAVELHLRFYIQSWMPQFQSDMEEHPKVQWRAIREVGDNWENRCLKVVSILNEMLKFMKWQKKTHMTHICHSVAFRVFYVTFT